MKRVMCILIALVFCLSFSASLLFANGQKVTLCHIPPGNPANAKTIMVDETSVADHLAHGDSLGPCN